MSLEKLTRKVLVCVVLILLGASAVRAQGPGPVAPRERTLVMPFEDSSREQGLFWLSEASAILLADDLSAIDKQAITREDRLAAFERMQVPQVAALSRATVIRLGQLVGATVVVMGSLALTDGELSVHGLAIRLDAGRVETEVRESGPLADLFVLFDRVARQLVGEPASAAAGATARPSLPVFENYVKGLLAGSVANQVGFLQAALDLDPGYDRARLALWAVHQGAGNASAALAMAVAVPQSSPLYGQARFAVALSLIELKRLDDAFATLKVLADRGQEQEPAVLNNLGVVQLRRDGAPKSGAATQYFEQAVKLDVEDSDYSFNLGYAHWVERDLPAAIRWLREAVRLKPADGDAHAVLAAALHASGSTTEATRERELAGQLASKYADWAKRPGEPIPARLERLKARLEAPSNQRLDVAMLMSGQREQRELVAFHLDRGRRFFAQGNDAEAEGELRRTLYCHREAEAHLLIGRMACARDESPKRSRR